MEPGPTVGGLAPPKLARWGEPAKLLPVAFVSGLIFALYYIHMTYHCVPRWERGQNAALALCEMLIFNIITGLLVMCYLWCILIHPGTIPDKDVDPSWEYVQEPGSASIVDPAILNPQEWKRSGDRRQCKWCAKYKPDRCHHCRVCRMCILKMDHHCPWIYNCVGFRNHKYFFLLLFYTALDCIWIVATMFPSVSSAFDPRVPFMKIFMLLFGETLAFFLGVISTLFFGFHVYLMLKAITTIEFCEKSTKRSGFDSSIYDRGWLGNIKAVLGDKPQFWLLPMSPPPGRGLSFVTEDMRLARDMEVGRHVRRRAHATSASVVAVPAVAGAQAGAAGAVAQGAGYGTADARPRRHSRQQPSSGGTGSAPESAAGSSEDEDTSLSDDPRSRRPHDSPEDVASLAGECSSYASFPPSTVGGTIVSSHAADSRAHGQASAS